MAPSIHDLASEWLRLDQDETTIQEMKSLVASGDDTELEKRLRKRIAFGTAGLRASMGAGFSRMNALTVIQASQGLAAYVLRQCPHARTMGIVIGRDARFNSEKFAKLAAAAFLAKGIKVWFLDLVHTPMVPFAVGKLGAAGGVMVTASHNPAADNGYKVYWSNGCQIIPPHDRGIAAAIEQNLKPLAWDISKLNYQNMDVVDALDMVQESYMTAVVTTAALPASAPLVKVPFVYTPMHGVGLPFFTAAIKRLGLIEDMTVVASQAHPDPTFPTVRFPNPEEKGALDLAMSTASAAGATLILANDPDADRFAVAELVESKWRQLTGNQLGVLLASHVLETSLSATGKQQQLAMLASTVSSKMLSRMADVDGTFHFQETLTGFKWLGKFVT